MNDDIDLRSCSLVCKSWRDGVYNPNLWYERAEMRGWSFQKNEKDQKSYRSLYITEVQLRNCCDLLRQVRTTQTKLLKKTSWFDSITNIHGIPLFKSNISNEDGVNHYHTLVTVLSHKQDDPVLLHLLQRGRNLINTTDKQGNTPLILAVNAKNAKIVEALIKLGADIEKGPYGSFLALSLLNIKEPHLCFVLVLILSFFEHCLQIMQM